MTTSTSQPPSQTDTTKLLHNISLAAIIICPALILLPPRKLDIYTITLLSGTLLGGNQLVSEYTGRSIVTRIEDFGARRTVEREEYKGKIAELRKEPLTRRPDVQLGEKKGGVLEEVRKLEGKSEWKEERDRREKEAEEEGRGYGDLIMDQVWEVWNWRKRKSDGDEDEKAEEDNKNGEGDAKR
jgi:hypothetical protein